MDRRKRHPDDPLRKHHTDDRPAAPGAADHLWKHDVDRRRLDPKHECDGDTRRRRRDPPATGKPLPETFESSKRDRPCATRPRDDDRPYSHLAMDRHHFDELRSGDAWGATRDRSTTPQTRHRDDRPDGRDQMAPNVGDGPPVLSVTPLLGRVRKVPESNDDDDDWKHDGDQQWEKTMTA